MHNYQNDNDDDNINPINFFAPVLTSHSIYFQRRRPPQFSTDTSHVHTDNGTCPASACDQGPRAFLWCPEKQQHGQQDVAVAYLPTRLTVHGIQK
jgi:hypothetical protein